MRYVATNWFPHWLVVIAAVSGAVDSLWGWWNLRNERNEAVATVVFLFGLLSWGYAVYGAFNWICGGL